MNNQAGDIQASRIRIASTDEIAVALDSAGLRLDRAVIVLVGGAGRQVSPQPGAARQRPPGRVSRRRGPPRSRRRPRPLP